MFWSEWGYSDSRIERASLDGSNRTVFHVVKGRVNGLTIDFSDNRLYWTEVNNKSIGSIRLDGSDARNVVTGNLLEPSSVTQFEDFIYWSDWKAHRIERANKNSGDERMVVLDDIRPYVTDLRVFHKNRQTGSNPCSNNNGGCSHLCIAHERDNPVPYHCTCPTHYKMADDERTCQGLKTVQLCATYEL